MIYDCIIIGAGPAGMTAGIYMLREKKNILILEKGMFGGQASESPKIENYPGIPSISGFELSNTMFEQLQTLGGDITFEEAKNIKRENDGTFTVITSSDAYQAKSIIVAAGCKHRKLGVPNEEKFIGNGISYCATCDGAFFIEKDVIVIGDANSALQYALSLSNICKSVRIYALFDRFFADDFLQEKIKNTKNITSYFNMQATAFIGENSLSAIDFYDKKHKRTEIVGCDGCFIAIGQVPDNDRFKLPLKNGFIDADEKLSPEKGIFVAGDCRVKDVRQVATAVGDGAQAAVNCLRYLQK